MVRSSGFRLFVVGLLAIVMFIPLFFVGAVIDDRANYSRDAMASVGEEWGGVQYINGPQLVIPVSKQVTSRKGFEVLDPATGQPQVDAKGEQVYQFRDVTEVVSNAPVYLYPDQFAVTLATKTEERHRGIFTVPVYVAEAVMSFDFPADEAATLLGEGEYLEWEQASVNLQLGSNRGLRGAANLKADGQDIKLEPLAATSDQSGGIFAALGDPRGIAQFQATIGLNGAESFSVTPVGRNSTVTMSGDWPHPSFWGAFLPDGSTVTDTGFSATWTIPHLARALPQIARENYAQNAISSAAFGVRFFQPNDFYQKAYRAARYGILYIALTFLTVFLLDRSGARPAHPVQYVLIGLAQSVFVLLMVAYAEQIGFGPAYGLASAATIALLVIFAATGLKLGRRSLVLGVMLAVLYAVLYLILRSADYALIAGATLAFLALAGTMLATRNENWYGPEVPPGVRRGLFGGRSGDDAPRAATKPDA